MAVQQTVRPQRLDSVLLLSNPKPGEIGAAKLANLLKSVGPKVLLVEEAGQVLEAHVLSSKYCYYLHTEYPADMHALGLVPSIEHLILIGDPLQLRPTIENYR